MEIRSLSLSRLQVLCHSLSKVLFKLSLTLLVRYRSSYSVFNFGRHIPADWHCTPKQCYSLDILQWDDRVYGSMGWHLLWLNTHMKGCVQQWVCFAHWISPFPHQSQQNVFATTQRLWDAIRQRVGSLFARRWLRESRLFSFPPLNNMLKFGG